MSFGDCEITTRAPKIVLEEKGRKLLFRNKSRHVVRKIRVDDCVIRKGLRCDFLVITADGVEHYVELKGSKVAHAAKQLATTIRKISADPQSVEKQSYVICSRVYPKLRTTIQQTQKLFRTKFKSTFVVKCSEHCVDI